MTSDELVQRNIALSIALARAIVDDPELLDEIPDGATAVLLPDDDRAVREENLKLAMACAHAGAIVYLRHVRGTPATAH